MKKYFKIMRFSMFIGAVTLFLSATTNPVETAKNEENVTVSEEAAFNHGTWTTNLRPENEVHDVDSEAFGKAIVTYRKNGNFYFRIILHNIDNVTGAHLHMGQPGMDGDIIVVLYADGPTGEVNGNFISGSFSAAEYPGLLQAVNDGNVYVNVHSLDFGRGEVRGQL